MAAHGVGGATDRNSLSTREANGATMLVKYDRHRGVDKTIFHIVGFVRSRIKIVVGRVSPTFNGTNVDK